jgi:hypothetical protein
MFAIFAFVVFLIGAILSWVDKTVSLEHLMTCAFIGLALLAAHFIWGWWGTGHHGGA